MKSLKGEKEKTIKYMLNLKVQDIQKVFKNDLLTDTLMNVFQIYIDQDEAFFNE